MKDCPACKASGSAMPAQGRGFWERKVLARLRLRPFRCRQCNKKFYAYHQGGPVVPATRQGEASAFLPASHDQDFREAVDHIRSREEGLQQGRRWVPAQSLTPPSAPDPPALTTAGDDQQGLITMNSREQEKAKLQRDLADAALRLIMSPCIRIDLRIPPQQKGNPRKGTRSLAEVSRKRNLA